jgi:hypothetical protein
VTAHGALVAARADMTLNAERFQEIRREFNATMSKVDRGMVDAYTTSLSAEGMAERKMYTVQVRGDMKTVLDDLSGVQTKFDDNKDLAAFSPEQDSR